MGLQNDRTQEFRQHFAHARVAGVGRMHEIRAQEMKLRQHRGTFDQMNLRKLRRDVIGEIRLDCLPLPPRVEFTASSQLNPKVWTRWQSSRELDDVRGLRGD